MKENVDLIQRNMLTGDNEGVLDICNEMYSDLYPKDAKSAKNFKIGK